jgi:uncharacterized protein (DUF2235 family)
MARNIVICCDGTANEFAAHRTNVVKLYYCLLQDPERQIVYYHPGLGTMAPPGALTPLTKKISRVYGLAFGGGLEDDIRDAYAFLMNAFLPGDKVYMFGFSRGAYTVRAIASLLNRYGLLPRGNEAFVPYAVRMLTGATSSDRESANAAFRLADEFRDTFDAARRCNPYFVGVWDTVSSVGWVENPLHLPDTANNPSIAYGRHAVALDERRAFFRTNLWWPNADPAKAGPKDIKQVWFPGVHCDVGGGYAEADSGLSKVALKWMLDEAAPLGLLYDEERKAKVLGQRGGEFVPPNPMAEMHESLSIWWQPAEYLLKKHYDRQTGVTSRKMNRGAYRTIPPNSLIHSSAYQRGATYTQRLPKDATVVN